MAFYMLYYKNADLLAFSKFVTDLQYLETCGYYHWIRLNETNPISCILFFCDYWMQNKLVKIYFLIFLLYNKVKYLLVKSKKIIVKIV